MGLLDGGLEIDHSGPIPVDSCVGTIVRVIGQVGGCAYYYGLHFSGGELASLVFGSGKGQAGARGSSLITDRPDTVLRLSTHGKLPDIRKLKIEKVRNSDSIDHEEFELKVDLNTGLFLLEPTDAEGTKIKSGEVMEILKERSPIPLGELKKELVAKNLHQVPRLNVLSEHQGSCGVPQVVESLPR